VAVLTTAAMAVTMLVAIGGGKADTPTVKSERFEVPDAPWRENRQKGLAYLRLLDPGRAEAFFTDAASRPMPARERAKTLLLLARARIAAGHPRDALKALDLIDLDVLPRALGDLHAWERARAMSLAQDPGAKDALTRFLKKNPDRRLADDARILLARELLKRKDAVGARRMALEVLKNAVSANRRAEALLVLAQASDEPEKREFLVRLVTEFPATPAAGKAGLKESDLDRDQLRKRADSFFKSMEYEGYQRVLESLWKAGDHSARLAMRLAMSHLIYVRDDARKAIEFLDLARKGGALGAAEAVYLKARSLARLEEYDQAADLYGKYLSMAPRGKRRVKALYYLGWLPYDHGRYQKALPYLDGFLRKVKRHKLRSYIVWAKAWSLYKLKRYREALKVFDRMIRMGNPLVAGKAMYWGGMADWAIGHRNEAVRLMKMVVERYPMTWYAVLGAKRLNQWEGTPLPKWMSGPAVGLPEPADYWPFDRLPPALAKRLREVRDLSEVGEIERARKAYGRIARRVERRFKGREKARLLLTVYDTIEDYHALYRRARSEFAGRMGGVPDRKSALFWMLRYPRAHHDLADVLSRRFAMPEHWIYSIMRQESRYRHGQVSHTAALGIMQMIPKTARVVSKALGVPFDVDSFFGPGRNLLFGNYYLGALLRDFKGQIVFASAAYNAGAPPIRRFMEAHRGLPFDEMVEHISYNEARNYCRMVAGHLVRYAYLHLTTGQRKALYEKLFPDVVDYDLGVDIDY